MDAHTHEFSTFKDGYYICSCGEKISESDLIENKIIEEFKNEEIKEKL